MTEIENSEQTTETAPFESEVSIKKPTRMFDKIMVNFYSAVCFTSSMLLVIVISVTTVLRYVFRTDLYGYEEWVKLFAFWLYFMGMSYGSFAGSHISADLVQSYVRDGFTKRLIIFIRCFVTVAISLLFTWYGYDFFMFGFLGPLGTGVAIPKTTAWRIPLWTSYIAIFLGFIFMTYYFIRECIQAGKELFTGGVSK